MIAALLGSIAAITFPPAVSRAQPAQPGNQPAPAERIAAVKKSFADSQAALRKYEWIETTVISLKGEEKSRVQKRCYYGAEGPIIKVALAPPPEEEPARGIRGKIKEKKKEELSEYMEEAAALVHKYLPPDPARIQAAKEAGNTSIDILDPGKRARLVFRNYLLPEDSLSTEIDLASNHILGASVKSLLGQEKDPVALDVRFDAFPDGTIYTSQTTLDAPAKKVTVVIQNNGFRKVGS